MVGRALHTRVGYNDRPTAMQLSVDLATLAAIFLLMRVADPKHTSRAQHA